MFKLYDFTRHAAVVKGVVGFTFVIMGLPPLEYVDCFVDAPNFRDIIAQYEKELDANSTYVKTLVKECRSMISATEGKL